MVTPKKASMIRWTPTVAGSSAGRKADRSKVWTIAGRQWARMRAVQGWTPMTLEAEAGGMVRNCPGSR